MVEERDVLAPAGIWSVEDLAKYLKTDPGELMQRLTDNGIKVLNLGQRYKLKLIRLEDLRAGDKKPHDVVKEE